jgi:hypothetical protein
MNQIKLKEAELADLEAFVKRHRQPELLPTYFYYLERRHGLRPVLFAKEKMIYQSEEDLISKLEAAGQLSRLTQIKIGFEQPSVNSQTKKIFICPFTGKVFGDNTHPNPQDAIYDWVSRCPQNTERVGGLPAKRFYISEDPQVIGSYVQQTKTPMVKEVFSSAVSGKLFYTKEAVTQDLRDHYLKFMSLNDVQNQNRYGIEASFLGFIQEHLTEERLLAFVEALSHHEAFKPYLERWVEEEESEEEAEEASESGETSE